MTNLFTIGYEGLNTKTFFTLLKRCGAEMIVDVRELPLSRKPGFSKAALAALCDQEEMEYIHVPKLGCPRDVRYAYRENGDWAAYTERFKAYLAKQGESLAHLARLADKRRLCLLCFEEDFNFCHRTYVAEGLVPFIAGDVCISHLTGPIIGRVVERREAEAA